MALENIIEHNPSNQKDSLCTLVENVKEYAIFLLDRNGVVISWNLGAEKIKGYKAIEIIGKHFSIFYTRDEIESRRPQYGLKVAMEEGSFHEESWRSRKDGSLFWASILITSIYDETGILLGFGKIVRDLTSKRQAEEILKETQEKYRIMVNSVTDYAILSLDSRGRITTWNLGAEKVIGFGADEIIGDNFSKFYLQEDIQIGKPEMDLKIAVEKGRFEDEGWRLRKDGSKFWASDILTTIWDHAGEVRGFTKITRDITERRNHEEEMKQKSEALFEANQELEAFCYSVSHDLRAPLRGIDGFSLALIEDYGNQLDDLAKNYLKRIRMGIQKMGQLIDDLLNLSRLSRSEMTKTEVNLSQIAEAIMTDLQKAEPHRTAEVTIQKDIIVNGDLNLMGVVMDNLLRNAWKFTRDRSPAKIEFGMKEEESGPVYFIKDNGVGFDMQFYKSLFGAFQRLHSSKDFAGTGVGLATVRRIISKHGGKVWAEARVNEGATFYFTI